MSKICIYIVIILMASTIFNSNIFVSSGGDTRSEDLVSNENEKIALSSITDPDLIDNMISIKARLDEFKQGAGNNFFTENNGQIGNDDVKFYIQGQGVWFTDSGVIFELIERVKSQQPEPNNFITHEKILEERNIVNEIRDRAIVRLEFIDNNKFDPVGVGELQHKSNFFYGNNPANWKTDVPNYQELLFENVYDKVDLRYYFNEEGLKYDLIVQPGGDPGKIAIAVKGANGLNINDNGDLEIKTNIADIIDKDLLVNQIYEDKTFEIPARFQLNGPESYGFEISDDYDRGKPLIIDPLIYSTYIGGSSADLVLDIEVDNDQNTILTGYTDSTNFPKKNAINTAPPISYTDIFVLKLNAGGSSLIFSAYLGGSENDTSQSMILDSNGNICIAGNTFSFDFPTTANANDTSFNLVHDVFVFKLNPLGNNLIFSTFIGGSNFDYSNDIILDNNGNYLVTGFTTSSDFPTTPDSYNPSYQNGADAFIFKLDNTGKDLLNSTLFGGTRQNGTGDQGYSLALDNKNDIYVTGITDSPDFLLTEGAYDSENVDNDFPSIFITKFDQNLTSVFYSTLFKGSGYDWVYNIFLDSENNTYITGVTYSSDLPVTENAFDPIMDGDSDGFVAKFNWNLSLLNYSTFIGGDSYDMVSGAALDPFNNLFIVGSTRSSDFVVTQGAYDTTYNGPSDIFIAALNLDHTSLIYSSFIGGEESEYTDCTSFDKDGFIYIGGYALDDFPTTPGCYDPTFNGGYDTFALKFGLNTTPIVTDMKISKNSVFRRNVIELYVNGSDYEDNEKRLTPHFEYKSPGISTWSSEFLSPPVYVNERWQTSFTIETNSSTGYYNFRIRFNDSDRLIGKWFYLNGSLEVLNNPPEIDLFDLSKFEAVIGENVDLIINGTDVEDELYELTFKPEYKHSDSQFWLPLEFDELGLINNKLVFSFSMDSDKPYGDYYFRAIAYDLDIGYSDWKYLAKSLLMLPAPPNILSIITSPERVYRTEVFDVYIGCSDPDSDIDNVYVELQYKHDSEDIWNDLGAEPIDDQWGASMQSKKTWTLGNYSFRARGIDFEDNTSPWSYLNNSLTVLNNVPEIISFESKLGSIERNGTEMITLNVKDKEDPEDELTIDLEYQFTGSAVWVKNYLSLPYYIGDHWNFNFTPPFNAATGYYSFRVRVLDLDGNWSSYSYFNDSLQVRNVEPVVKSFDQTPFEVFREETVIITADGSDVETSDDLMECNIYYQVPNRNDWKDLAVNYNKTSGRWYSELITTSSFVLGNYSFKVEFRDSQGIMSRPSYANQSVLVKNNPPVISDELDNIQIGSTHLILDLNKYGFDVETPGNYLKWIVDSWSVNEKMFYIDDSNISNQVIGIYPKLSKNGQDDITLILVDSDNSKIRKENITIIFSIEVNGETEQPDDANPMKKIVEGNLIWLYILVIITIIILFVLFIFYRRKKKQKEEEIQREKEEAEKALKASGEEALPAAETGQLPPVEPVAEPSATLEPASEPAPVPMPAPAETPQLPVVAAQPEEQPEAQPEPSSEPRSDAPETKIVEEQQSTTPIIQENGESDESLEAESTEKKVDENNDENNSDSMN